jgi:Flp pilus assembly pilin Flp
MGLISQGNAFIREEDGVTSIEYVLVILLIALAAVSGITLVGLALVDAYIAFDGLFRAS